MKHPRLVALLGAVAATSLTLSGSVYANHDDNPAGIAQVKTVEPVKKLITTRTPYQECWEEEVTRADNSSRGRGHRRSSTPSIIGALIGGGIGNALGHHSSNQKVGAVVGAILGSSIAKDIQRDSQHGTRTTRTTVEEVCETHYREAQHEKIVAYRVAYEYGGNIYHTTLDEAPGNTMPVWVNVRPAL
ncbi:MAG: hypothetical protein ACI9GW_000959 [Halieaceae bacterium]|jgi:uncharacterized protein YcfJ